MEEKILKVFRDRIVYYNKNKQYHNDIGPAVEWYDGDREWWINGNKISEAEFIQQKRDRMIKEIITKVV